MSLSRLSSDVLDYILQIQGSSYLVVRLWKCGDRLLNAKLGTGLSNITISQDYFLCFPLPRMLRQLVNLRSASISMAHHDMIFADLRYGMLPKGLQSLEIVFTRPKDTTRPIYGSGAERASLAPATKGLLLETLFPQLLSLHFIVKGGEAWIPFAKTLPSTLTSLRISQAILEDTSFIPLLPQSLRQLEATFFLELDFKNESRDDVAVLSGLSQAAERVNFAVSIAASVTAPKATHWTRFLPQGLRELALTDTCTPALIAAAPRSLTDIELQSAFKLGLQAATTEFEPLVLDGVAFNDSYSIWPPSLQTLRIRCNKVAPGIILGLPRTLTKLTLVLDSELMVYGGLIASELPPRLEELALNLMAYRSEVLVIEGILPTSLKVLDCESLIVLSNESVAALPPTLQHLRLSVHVQSDMSHAAWALPTCLTSLDLTNWAFLWFSEIPRSVTSLSIYRLHFPFSAEPIEDLFGSLPTGLKSLKIWHTSPFDDGFLDLVLQPTALACFPQLETLRLSKGFSVLPNIARHLPRSLTELHITLSSLLQDGAELAHLPPHLKTCDFGNDDFIWTWSHVTKYWPITATSSIPLGNQRRRDAFLKRYRALDI